MLDYTELRWFIEDIYNQDIDQEIKAEWLKNITSDYLWPIFDFKYLIPYNIAPKGKVVIAYNTIRFSDIKQKNFVDYGILIDGKNIIIDCLNKHSIEGIDKLKDLIIKMKEIIC